MDHSLCILGTHVQDTERSSKMTPGIPIFTEWWEMAVFILLGLILACIGILFSPIILTAKLIEYIRR